MSDAVVGRKVYPGDPLCTIEEYIPGDGVYVDDKGVIRAARFGIVEIDGTSRRIHVKPFSTKPRIPRKGVSVYGIAISSPREELMLIKIFADERIVGYSGTFTGVLHVSQIADHNQARTVYDYVKPGDIVRVTVISNTPAYIVSMRRPQDGVIMAFCSVCGAPLYRMPGTNRLICIRCGNEETRKVSPYYILVDKRRRK